MVVDDMAIMPPRKIQSIRLPAEPGTTATPNNIVLKMMVHAAIAAPPTFTIFLKLNSNPVQTAGR